MKSWQGYLLATVLACVTQSCDAEEVQAAKMELRENWDELERFAIERRDEVQMELGQTFDRIGVQLDRIEERLRDASHEADEEAAKAVAELRQHRVALGQRLEEMRNAGADTWHEIRVEVIESMRALERSVADTWNRIVD